MERKPGQQALRGEATEMSGEKWKADVPMPLSMPLVEAHTAPWPSHWDMGHPARSWGPIRPTNLLPPKALGSQMRLQGVCGSRVPWGKGLQRA